MLKAPGGGGDRQVDRVRAESIQQGGDQRRELLLDTRRRDHIERALPRDQLPEVDLRCHSRIGGGSDRRAGRPRERDLRRAKHRGPVIPNGLRGDPGKLLQSNLRIRFAQYLCGLGELRTPQPPPRTVNTAGRKSRRMEQRRQERACGDGEVLAMTNALVSGGGGQQRGGYLNRAIPTPTPRERREAHAPLRVPKRAGRVIHRNRTPPRTVRGALQNVALRRG